jgi:hypothetical protein
VTWYDLDGAVILSKHYSAFSPWSDFVGLISNVPIGSMVLNDFANDGDGIYYDDLIFEPACIASPPAITSAAVNKTILWPANHRSVTVSVGYTVTGSCGSQPVCQLNVTSNEADNGLGDGDTPIDIVVQDAHTVELRAERSGAGSGRIYNVEIACSDGGSTQASQSLTVLVPHSIARK